MAVLQMQRFSICAMKKDRKAILEELQVLGVLEINDTEPEDDVLKRMDTLEARQSFEKYAALADQALEVLQEYAPEKTSMFAFSTPYSTRSICPVFCCFYRCNIRCHANRRTNPTHNRNSCNYDTQ